MSGNKCSFSRIPSMGVQLLVTLSPQGRPFTLGLCAFTQEELTWSILNPFGSQAKCRCQERWGLMLCVHPGMGRRRQQYAPASPNAVSTSSSPDFQKAYCRAQRDPYFYKILKVHMNFEKRVEGNAKVSTVIKNISG